MARILIVEDSPTQARQVAYVLTDAGFAADISPDAEEGFDKLAAGRYDLVLSDLMLPGGTAGSTCAGGSRPAPACGKPWSPS